MNIYSSLKFRQIFQTDGALNTVVRMAQPCKKINWQQKPEKTIFYHTWYKIEWTLAFGIKIEFKRGLLLIQIRSSTDQKCRKKCWFCESYRTMCSDALQGGTFLVFQTFNLCIFLCQLGQKVFTCSIN
jgi:hypothetical protein